MLVSLAIVRALATDLQKRGFTGDRAHAVLGVKEDELLDVRKRVSYGEMHRIVVRAMRAAGEPGLGLAMGNQLPDTMLQTLGSLVLSGRTLRHAFFLFERYVPLLAEGMTWKLVEDGELAMFVYECTGPAHDDSARFAAEYVMTMVLRVALKFIVAPDAAPERVLFRHPKPEYAHRYDTIFNCPVEFGREFNAIVCDAKLLDIPQPFSDAAMHEVFLELAERTLSQLDAPARKLGDRLRLMMQHDIELASRSAPEVASRLGLTTRQLRRRLSLEGASLTELANDARRDYACAELRHGRAIEQIASALGFSERSAFHRAFKRWTGDTPHDYLNRHRHWSWRSLA